LSRILLFEITCGRCGELIIGGNDVGLIKQDANGTIQWKKLLGGSSLDFLNVSLLIQMELFTWWAPLFLMTEMFIEITSKCLTILMTYVGYKLNSIRRHIAN
jgi:hypothetical protein